MRPSTRPSRTSGRASLVLSQGTAWCTRRERSTGETSGPTIAEGPAYHEPQKSIVRCLEYGTRCPQLAESQAAFRRNEIAVSKVPADRRLVLDINRPESMDARALARYLGRPVPAFRAIPISALNFCSYDGVLRGPFGFRLSADELKHSSVRSTDHK